MLQDAAEALLYTSLTGKLMLLSFFVENENKKDFVEKCVKYFFPSLFSRRLRKWNRRCRRMCRKLVKSQAFYWVVIVMVSLNTGVLTSEHYRQPLWLDKFQGNLSQGCAAFVFSYISPVIKGRFHTCYLITENKKKKKKFGFLDLL